MLAGHSVPEPYRPIRSTAARPQQPSRLRRPRDRLHRGYMLLERAKWLVKVKRPHVEAVVIPSTRKLASVRAPF